MSNKDKHTRASDPIAPVEPTPPETPPESPLVEPMLPVEPETPAEPERIGSRRLAAEQEAGRAALQRKHSPLALEREKGRGGKKK